jgi:hypothetical protein
LLHSNFAEFLMHSNSLAKCLTKIGCQSPLPDFSLAAHGKLVPVPISLPSHAHVPIPALCYRSPSPPTYIPSSSGRQNCRASSSPSKIRHQITLPITIHRAICVRQCRLSVVVQAGVAESPCPRCCLFVDLFLLAQVPGTVVPDGLLLGADLKCRRPDYIPLLYKIIIILLYNIYYAYKEMSPHSKPVYQIKLFSHTKTQACNIIRTKLRLHTNLLLNKSGPNVRLSEK